MAADPLAVRDRHSLALAGWSTERLLRLWTREPLWQRRIAELLLFARADELDAAAWRGIAQRLATLDEHVAFFVQCRRAVLQQDVQALLLLFPAGCEYPDWIRAAGDLQLANRHVLERWEAILRGRQYARVWNSKHEVVLALGKLGAVVGRYAAELVARQYVGDGVDVGLREWTVARCSSPAAEWRACGACRHGVVLVRRGGWWRPGRDFAQCEACQGRTWLRQAAGG